MLKKFVCCYLVIAMFVFGIVPRLDAAFTPSVSLGTTDRAGDLEKIRVTLQQKVVAQRLHDLGFSANEVSDRMSQLSDQQIHYFAQQLDEMEAGGDVVGWIVVLAIIALIVFLLLPMVGVRVFG